MKNKSFNDLIDIIKTLRGREGCPWDKKQTVESFRPYLVEEMYELLEAVDEDHPGHIRDELGDMLFQILFLANLYEEKEIFTIDDSIRAICAKMLRRHPHVFGDEKDASEEDIRRNWKKIKEDEKRDNGEESQPPLQAPAAMPALNKAHKISTRAARTGFEWPDVAAIFTKLNEEIEEMRVAIDGGDQDEMTDELGDILFVVVNLARKTGLDSETALNHAIKKFVHRFTRLSELADTAGNDFSSMDADEVIRLWNRAKTEISTRKGYNPPPEL